MDDRAPVARSSRAQASGRTNESIISPNVQRPAATALNTASRCDLLGEQSSGRRVMPARVGAVPAPAWTACGAIDLRRFRSC